MDIYGIHYSVEAFTDLDSIFCYIAFEQAEPSIAKMIYEAINCSIENLCTFPKRNPLMGCDNEKRSFNIKNYLVIYRVDDGNNTVTIVRILGAKQDVQSKLC